MADVEWRVHNHRGVFLLALGIGVGGAVLQAGIEEFRSPLFGFVCAVLVLVGAIGVLDRRPKLVVSDDGIVYAGWGPASHPWEEFAGYRWVRWRQQPYLQLVARQPGPLLQRFSFLGRLSHRGAALVGMPTFAIAVTPLAVTETELEALVGRYLPAAAAR